MSKVTFEMDGDEYCNLMRYKYLCSINEWEELKSIKDDIPVCVESRQYDNFGNYNKITKYFSKGELFNDITKLNQELTDSNQKLKNENNSLKFRIDKSNFKDRLKFVFSKGNL
jgi:hypothetical protein